MAKTVLVILSVLILAFTQSKVHCEESLLDNSQYGETYKQRVDLISRVLKGIEQLDAWFNDSEQFDSNTRSKIMKKMFNNNDYRRLQQSRWDVGFGKRSGGLLKKSFLDSLFEQSSIPKKFDLIRRPQWDVTYGRK